MATLFDHLKALSVEIGPRGSATLNERKAAEYIEQTMKRAGLDVTIQKFMSYTTFSWVYAFIYSLDVVAALLFPVSPPMSFLLCLLAFACFYAESNTWEVVSRFMPKKLSQNVIIKIKARGEPKRRVAVVAHYDTSKPGLNFNPTRVRHFRTYFLFTVLAMFLNTILYGLAILFQYFNPFFTMYFWFGSLPFVFYLAFVVLTLFHREYFFTYTNGANDNASGASVMLRVSEILGKNPLSSTEVWCLATGCEEVGTVGMLRFLQEYGQTLKNALFINVDNVGAGNLKYVVGEGILGTHRVPKMLIDMAKEVAESRPELNVQPFVYKTLTTDATPALARGFRAMSIMAFNDLGILPNWHWPTDVYENIEEKTISSAEIFILEILKAMDLK